MTIIQSRAIECCNVLMSKFGSDKESFMLRGIAKCYIRATNLGKLDLERALHLDPRNPLILYNLALVTKYMKDGYLDTAIEVCQLDTALGTVTKNFFQFNRIFIGNFIW